MSSRRRHRYTIIVMWGSTEHVSVRIPANVGALIPPNIPSNIFNLTFAPSTTLTLTDGLSDGAVTSVVSAILTITFNADVSGFELAAMVLEGVTATNFTQESPSRYGLNMGLLVWSQTNAAHSSQVHGCCSHGPAEQRFYARPCSLRERLPSQCRIERREHHVQAVHSIYHE